MSQNNYFPPSWAPQARSEAWEVYPWELYPPNDPPRPSRPKAGLGLVMMMMMVMMTKMMMVLMMTRLVVRPLSYCYSSCPPFTAHLPRPLRINKRNFLGKRTSSQILNTSSRVPNTSSQISQTTNRIIPSTVCAYPSQHISQNNKYIIQNTNTSCSLFAHFLLFHISLQTNKLDFLTEYDHSNRSAINRKCWGKTESHHIFSPQDNFEEALFVPVKQLLDLHCSLTAPFVGTRSYKVEWSQIQANGMSVIQKWLIKWKMWWIEAWETFEPSKTNETGERSKSS